jgi:hypothetical protein
MTFIFITFVLRSMQNNDNPYIGTKRNSPLVTLVSMN